MKRTCKLLAAAVALAGPIAVTSVAEAGSHSFQRGPDPTEASISATRGPFAISEFTVQPGSGSGFNGGTIYYPTVTRQGTFGAIVVMPGFLSPQSHINWYGPRLASQGFVVMTMDSNTLFDFPTARGNQMLAALNYLTTRSTVRGRIDRGRLAVMGWSMGGGAALEAEAASPSLKAGIALAPWDLDDPASRIRTPTMIQGATDDIIAPVTVFAQPFYSAITGVDKAFMELNGAHASFSAPNSTIAKYTIAWMKRFVDDDTRYNRFLCPAPHGSSAIALFLATCPL